MRKLTLLFLLLGAICLQSNAQEQDNYGYSLYSQYIFNGLVLNPAYAGTIENVTSLTSFYKSQWAAISGAPVDISISAHAPFGKRKRVGLGISLSNERVGLSNHYDLGIAYSYKFELNNGDVFSAGLQGGAFLYQANLLDGETPDGVGVFDPELDFESAWGPNFGMGFYYYSDNFYLGLSTPQLLKYTNPVGADTLAVERSEIKKIQYLLTGGYVFDINDEFKVRPSFLMRVIPALIDPIVLDINATLFIKEVFSVGNTWRFSSGIEPSSTSFMVGYTFTSGLRIGYAYDYSFFSDVTGFASSHEVMIGFDIFNGTSRTGAMSPRYF